MISGSSSRERSAARRAWAAATNTGVPAGAQLSYEGAHPFGGDRVHRWRLGNGLTILLLVDASAPIVSYHTWFKVGSRHERQGKTGLAHLFEHLMFNETENLRAGTFDRKLEENGAAHVVNVDKVVSSEAVRPAGMDAFIFRCQSEIRGVMKQYELAYRVKPHRWELYKA